MKLPKISHPTFSLVIPSTKQEVRYRPFLVKEEKILLFAQESKEPKDIINAIKQIITNCVVTEGVNVDSLTTYDIEYFFIQLRAQSVNDQVKLSYIDNEDNKQYTFEVDLKEVQVVYPEGHNPLIVVTNNSNIKLREPAFSILEEIKASSENEVAIEAIARCIEMITVEGVKYDPSDFSPEEVKEFVQDLDVVTFLKIQEFFDTVPRMEYTINYTNSLGNPRKITLSTLEDFFSWG